MMDRLERKEWIRRIRSTEDRREVRCRLTAAGKLLVDSLDAVVNQAEINTFGALTQAEQRKLVELLDKVRRSRVRQMVQQANG